MEWLKRFLTKKSKLSSNNSKISLTPDQFEKMLKMIENTQEEELSCDEAFELLDIYAEMAARGKDVQEMYPLVRHHLDMCPDCREEYEAIIRILNEQSN